MMCQRIGWSPIGIMGFGQLRVSSHSRVPSPPARMTAFMDGRLLPERVPSGNQKPATAAAAMAEQAANLVETMLPARSVAGTAVTRGRRGGVGAGHQRRA